MTSLLLLYFGLLTVFAVMAVEFEYDAEIAKDFETVQEEAGKLLCELIDPATKVIFRRTGITDGKGRHFRVDTQWKGSKKPSETSYGKPKPFPVSLASPSFKSTVGVEVEVDEDKDKCERRPGIRATLNKKFFGDWGSEPWRDSHVFCLDEIYIGNSRNREGIPYMTLTVTFNNYAKEETIEVVVYPFKPSTNQNYVPFIDLPVPFQGIISDTDGSQMFIGDILWMTKVLELAKLKKGETDNSGKYTEYYSAGPVILQPSSFQKVLDLGCVFD